MLAKVENHCHRLIVTCIVTEYVLPGRYIEAMKNGGYVSCFIFLGITLVWLVNLSAASHCSIYMAVLSNAYAIFLNKHVLIKIQFSELMMFYQMACLNVFKADFSRAGGSDGAPREIPGLLDRGAVCDRNHIGSVLEEAMSCFSQMQRQTEETLCVWMEKLTHLDTGEENNPLLEPRGLKMQLVGQSLSLITQSGAYMQMPDFQELPQQPFDSYVTCWSVDSTLEFPKTCNSFSVNLAENGNISEQPLNLSQNCVNYLLFGLCKKEFVFAHCKFLLIFKNYNSKQFLF